MKVLGMSKRTGRTIRICFVEVSQDLVLLGIRKSIFNVILPEEEDPLLLEEEDLRLPEEEDLLLLEEEDLLLLEERFTFLRKTLKRCLFGSLSISIGLKRFEKVRSEPVGKGSAEFGLNLNLCEPLAKGSNLVPL